MSGKNLKAWLDANIFQLLAMATMVTGYLFAAETAHATAWTADTSQFTGAMDKFMSTARFVGLVFCAAGYVYAAVQWWFDEGHQSKGLVLRVTLATLIVVIAPWIIKLLLEVGGVKTVDINTPVSNP